MSTATVSPCAAGRVTAAVGRPAASADPTAAASVTVAAWPPPDSVSSAMRAFLSRYVGTLMPLVAALIAFEFGWQLLADRTGAVGQTWPAAAAATVGWALAVAALLYRRGWSTGGVVAVIAAPAAALAVSAAAGWLSPAGLVLWGPVSTVLTVALASTASPVPPRVN